MTLSLQPVNALLCFASAESYETLIALDGPMDYSVNGLHVYLEQGDAIFVNSRRLHYGYSAVHQERHYCFAVFHPELLGLIPAIASTLEQLSRDSSPDYWDVSVIIRRESYTTHPLGSTFIEYLLFTQ